MKLFNRKPKTVAAAISSLQSNIDNLKEVQEERSKALGRTTVQIINLQEQAKEHSQEAEGAAKLARKLQEFLEV